MSKTLKRREDAASRGSVLWIVIGRRLQLRRTELGAGAKQVAHELGIPARTYAAYETGNAETPALVLSQIADLFDVPVSWFFQDVAFGIDGDDEPCDDDDAPGIFTVASEEERIQALSDCFRRLDLDSQQHLLAIAGALSQSSEEWRRD
jgi:transcriptional regulator with XRE-family HTH domain